MAQKRNIDQKQLQRGIKVELKEHPWAGIAVATRIATDHIIEHPRSAYKKRD